LLDASPTWHCVDMHTVQAAIEMQRNDPRRASGD